MRFHADGPLMPDILLERRDAGRVVFLCGAGVSLPSGMPDFVGLTRHVIESFDPPEDSGVMTAFEPWRRNRPGPRVPLDQIFNLLHQEYGRNDVNALVTERLTAVPKSGKLPREHDLIKRISSSRAGAPQIVTTNFDRLFEIGGTGAKAGPHVPPALPDLARGASIEGITYLHGRLAEAGAVDHRYVLSSADFGRAYLADGWATDFVRELLKRYTVVLVGYQAEDPPIKYLLQGLSQDGEHDRSRLYVLDKGLHEDIEAKWRDRGATAVAFPGYPQLWQTMEAWAERADDPRDWRASVISTTRRDPKGMAPHERGQVAHVLRTNPGARLLSRAGSAAHPEWICVLDASVRAAEPDRGFGTGDGTFDPGLAYGLDDDLGHVSEEDRLRGIGNDNLLAWRPGDDSPHEFHRLGGRQAEGAETMPTRLGHLVDWIRKSVHSPVLAWWAVRQNGLHPRLLHCIEREVSDNDDLHESALHAWNLVLEHHRDPRSRHWDGSWFHFRKRVAAEGWTDSVLRDFRRVSRPRLEIRPSAGLDNVRPPTAGWDDIQLRDLGRVELKFLERHDNDLVVPDTALPQVFRILEDQLAVASGLLADVGTRSFTTPTCYQDREADGEMRHPEAAEVMILFVKLFERLTETRPELARAHVLTWPEADRFYFRKIKLYGLSRERLFEAEHAAKAVASLDQDAFWDTDVARELLFLLTDRWGEFSPYAKARLTERILDGPDQRDWWPDDEIPRMRRGLAARYGRYLELHGCDFTPEHAARLSKIVAGLPDWSDALADSTVTEPGMRVGWVGIDEAPDSLVDLPVGEIVAKAKSLPGRGLQGFTERRPFKGLVRSNPRMALSALTAAGKKGEYPAEQWSVMIDGLPDDIRPRLKRVFMHRIGRLPDDAIIELRYNLGRWLEEALESILDLDEDLAWGVYDHVVDGIRGGGEEAATSSQGDVFLDGKVIRRSRRTLDHAINGPLGMCAEALFKAVPGETHEAGSLLPDQVKTRLERLLSASGEGADHAVSVTTRRLNWLMHVDPEWTRNLLVPMLDFDNPASEPAWNGFLNQGKPSLSALAVLVKPLLLDLHPWIEGFAWERELSDVAGQWLGLMRIFRPDQPDGLTRREMRSVLRSMSDAARHRFISWLAQVGKGNDNGWTSLVVPFLEEAWPKERRFRTSLSARAWLGLLEDSDDSFPAVYPAVKKFLVPVEPNGYSFFRFTRETDEDEPITTRFPEVTLDLVDAVTPGVVTGPPYELPGILGLIAETDRSLASDPRYLRLIDLVEQS